MKLHDIVFGLIFALIGVATVATTWTFPKMPGQDVGPAAFPGTVGAAMVLAGLLLVWRGRTAPQRSPRLVAFGPWAASPRHVAAGATTVLGVALYAALAHRLGFLIVMPPLLFAWHLTLGVRWSTALVSAFASTLIIWGVFYKMLGVPLPWGLLKAYAF